MMRRRIVIPVLAGLVWVVLAGVVPSGPAVAAPDPVGEAYVSLDRVRDNCRDQLVGYLDRIRDLAVTAAGDSVVQAYFGLKQRYWRLQQVSAPPETARRDIERLRASFRDYFVANYMTFYDMLFVDDSGYVLSTIRRQGDYHADLFAGELAETALARQLRSQPGESFVDYEFFWVSDEPSAFFVEPMVIGGERRGWLVMQCALNRINDIFVREDELGRTGDVFLVNRDRRMLTESHLLPDHRGLARFLARENIEPKFALGEGHRRVVDYRGYPALTSFTTCTVAGTRWLVVAKIDEDEVLTRAYREAEPEFLPGLRAAVAADRPNAAATREIPVDPAVVDMDEFRFSNGRPLVTFGVATCTAVVVSLPDGRSYLAHASERDRIYGGEGTDLVGNLMHRVNQFEIQPYRLRDVRVAVVAPHLQSLAGVIRTLTDSGLLLSQIRVLHHPGASSATVVHEPAGGRTFVRWSTGHEQAYEWQYAGDAARLGDRFRALLPAATVSR